jgi:hypothetical protein
MYLNKMEYYNIPLPTKKEPKVFEEIANPKSKEGNTQVHNASCPTEDKEYWDSVKRTRKQLDIDRKITQWIIAPQIYLNPYIYNDARTKSKALLATFGRSKGINTSF